MQETFEHNISQQLDDFKLQPSPVVWQEVDKALRPERKKRIIIWWWLGAAMLIIGTLSFWATYYSPKNIFKTITNNSITSHSLIPKIKDPVNTETQIKGSNQFIIDKQEVIRFKNQQIASIHKPSDSIIISKKNIDSSSYKIVTKELATNTIKSIQHADNVMVITEKLEPSTLDLDKKIDSTNNTSIIANKHNADTSIIFMQQKKASKSSRWVVTFGGGILQTNLKTTSNNLAFSNSTIGSGVVTGATNNTPPTITSPKTGYNIQFGIAYNTDLDKHWALQTGLQYIYLTNKQGLKADTTTGFANSFIAYNNSFIANKTHWLQVPITLAYNLQPKSKHKLCLLLGGSIAYTLSEKWLISNTSTGRFYYDTTLNNIWLVGIQGGLSYAINKRLQIAALAEYSLSPIQSQVADKNHFVQYNLQISCPINLSKTKKNKK